MQTFLPSVSFLESARVLDRARLGKQRVEAKQILQAILGEGSLHWRNHPAVRMWRDYPIALADYGTAICLEWRARGYQDTLLEWFARRTARVIAVRPPWLDEEFCARHRAALLAKFPEHYARFGWKEEPKIDYIWPVGGSK